MHAKPTSTIALGDLVTAAYDAAEQLGGDAQETNRLATRAITHLLRRARTGAHRSVH